MSRGAEAQPSPIGTASPVHPENGGRDEVVADTTQLPISVPPSVGNDNNQALTGSTVSYCLRHTVVTIEMPPPPIQLAPDMSSHQPGRRSRFPTAANGHSIHKDETIPHIPHPEQGSADPSLMPSSRVERSHTQQRSQTAPGRLQYKHIQD